MTNAIAQIPVHGTRSSAMEPLFQQIAGEIAEGQLFGMQVYISVGQRVLADAGVGWSRGDLPMLRESITHWLCCSKPLIALLIARLVESRRVDIEQRVTSYVPEFGCRAKEEITLRQLLTHTSGMVGDAALEYMFCPWEAMVEAACQSERQPDWDPERRARYIDFTSWIVLSEIVRRATGLRVGECLKRSFFSELGMIDSHLGMPMSTWDEYGERVSLLHVAARPRPRECAVMNWRGVAEYDWPAFGARGPAFELGRLYEALLGFGPQLVDRSLLDQFTTPCRFGTHDEAWGDATAWGLGFISDEKFWGLAETGQRVYGHTGLGSSFSLAVPAWHLVVVCVGNTVALPGVHRQRIQRFMGLVENGLRSLGEVS